MKTVRVVATVEYLGDRYAFVDCPGSVEFAHAAKACGAGAENDAADRALVIARVIAWGVGTSVSSVPRAAFTALTTVAATGIVAISPTALAPNGPPALDG